MYRFKKLNARGASHIIALMLIIVGCGIVGSYLLIASHADPCGMSDPVSDPTSSPTCPVSGPASVSCVIDGVVANPVYGQKFSPTVTVTNGTDQPVDMTITEGFHAGQAGGSQDVALPEIAPGASDTESLNPYTVGYAHSNSPEDISGEYTVTAGTKLSCSASFILPTKSQTYTATCKVDGIPQFAKPGRAIEASLVIHNTGTGALDLGLNYSYTGKVSGLVYGKNLPSHKIGPGVTTTVKLPAYTPPKAFSDSYSYAVQGSEVNGGYLFNCQGTVNVKVSTIKSVVIKQGDWNAHGGGVSDVTINPGGPVKRLVGNSTGIAEQGSYTSNNKVVNFLLADMGRQIKFCAAGKVANGGAVQFSAGAQFSIDYKKLTLGTTFGTHCTTITIKKLQYISMSLPFGVHANTYGSKTGKTYIGNVTMTLE